MTKSSNANNQFGPLKTALVLGSVMASLLGTKFLTDQETATVATLPAPTQIVVPRTANPTIDFQLPPALELNLAPIPTLGSLNSMPTIITPGVVPTIGLPQAIPSLIDLAPIPNIAGAQAVTIKALEPIPTVVAPQPLPPPVTNSRSSG